MAGSSVHTSVSLINRSSHFEETGYKIDVRLDIVISMSNVVTCFNVGCSLNLKELASRCHNIEFHTGRTMMTMRLRNPQSTATIWTTGKVVCLGSKSENDAHKASRRYARCLQKLNENVGFGNYRVVNVVGHCSLPFQIDIKGLVEKHRGKAQLEPELHPALTYRYPKLKATLRIFSTGKITVMAPKTANVERAVQKLYSLVSEFQVHPSTRILQNSQTEQEDRVPPVQDE